MASKLIKDLDAGDRPREKVLAGRLKDLTNAELMALLFATGIKGKSVIELCDDILRDNGNPRITLKLLYPGSLKAVHTLPAIFVLGSAALILLSIFVRWWFILPLAAYVTAVFAAALASTRSLKIAALAVPSSLIQLWGYGCGFIKAFVIKILLGRGRDEAEEIALRKGK